MTKKAKDTKGVRSYLLTSNYFKPVHKEYANLRQVIHYDKTLSRNYY